jgi:uncharacterized protein YbaR (Trm112 family)
MVDQKLLEILVCPETKQPVRPADGDLLSRVNEAVSRGSLKNRGGAPVEQTVVEGLVREDGTVLYPVRDDIPVMLLEEAIPLEGLG